jgi:hypothetical protein
VPGDGSRYQLSGVEVASRLSYFLWGSTPADWMLDLAESGGLDTVGGVRAAATQALADPRARGRIGRFHALWLGYDTLPFDPALAMEMRTESDSLVNRVVFDEQRPWQDLFRFGSTFINDDLAKHYGLPAPGSTAPVWVSYGTSGRQGILSHGTFLSNGAKFGDTSPTQRGLAVRRRLLCQDVPPPPPGVNVDQPPTATTTAVCKVERYQAHTQGGCASCHQNMDPIGFGLENYDQAGAYRAADTGNASCVISGLGTVAGVGDFKGPAGLEDLLLQTGSLNPCAVTQLFRFETGHYQLDAEDTRVLGDLTQQMSGGDFPLNDLILAMVARDSFRYVRNTGDETHAGP